MIPVPPDDSVLFGEELRVVPGNKRIELKPGKPTIEVGAAENLLPTIQAVREAVAAGELDALLMAAKKERGRPRRKAAA